MDKYNVIIGYYGLMNYGYVVCDGEACIIAGSHKAMKEYLKLPNNEASGSVTILKIRFGEILSGMSIDAAYAFDEQSYGRFLPLARSMGMPLEEVDFTPDNPGDVNLYTVTPSPKHGTRKP